MKNAKQEVANISPGTTLEGTFADYKMNFYLASQKVTQGTVSPTHFNVIHNSGAEEGGKSSMTLSGLQNLTYQLTFLYYNWPGTIRVPAVLQYSHKIAYLYAQNIERSSKGMEYSLHFL